jgi:hypothetical protein
MKSYLHTWIGDEPRGSLPCTLAELLAFGVPMSAIESDMRGELKTIGPWQIPVSYRALAMSTVYTDETRAMWSAQTDSKTVHGMRTMTQCHQEGYQLEGRVTVDGKSHRAFTSSQLFSVRMPDGTIKLVKMATIHVCIDDKEQTAQITALRAAGLIPSHVAKQREPITRAETLCALLGYR